MRKPIIKLASAEIIEVLATKYNGLDHGYSFISGTIKEDNGHPKFPGFLAGSAIRTSPILKTVRVKSGATRFHTKNSIYELVD